jgi:histidyl-tRNA synthetase
MTEQKIVRPTPVSGFPEWLPEVRIVEQHWSPGLDDLFSGLDDEMAEGLAEWIITAPGGRQIALRRLHRDADNGLAGKSRARAHRLPSGAVTVSGTP